MLQGCVLISVFGVRVSSKIQILSFGRGGSGSVLEALQLKSPSKENGKGAKGASQPLWLC